MRRPEWLARETEQWEADGIITPAVSVLSAVLSFALVSRMLSKLDLVSVLKARD